MTSSPKVALFGGTFDPVHEGHLDIAEKAMARLRLASLIFVPCRQSPHKDQPPGAGDDDRLAMLRLATSSLPGARVDEMELQKPPPSYTWETVAHFQAEFPPPSHLHLLIGLDQWENLPRWNRSDFLRQNLTFIVVGRERQPKPRSGYRTCFIYGDHPASSSRIRQDLREGKRPRWLPPSVRTYIREKGLYLSTD